MTRRAFLTAAALAPAVLRGDAPKTGMGVATTSYLTVWKPKDPMEFLEHCHTLGAGGVQMALSGDLGKLRGKAEEYGMYIEAMVPMPAGRDGARFERALEDAQKAGAVALRSGGTGGRRYESFRSLEAWEKFAAENQRSFETAVPLLERYKIPLGLENHKDFTLDGMIHILQRFSSEYFGACLDFGNNIAMLDEPMETIRKLAPYAVTTHIKDMGVASYPDGFLLSEVPLGDGLLDLPTAIATVRKVRPKAKFTLEMITRDPLKVPCLTDPYWVTFPERSGLQLARTLRLVRAHETTLPMLSHFDAAKQRQVEEQNVQTCLQTAQTKLGL